MERKTTTVCSYRKCRNSYKKKSGIRMFRFPKHLSQEWLRNSGNPKLIGLSPNRLYKNKRLCEEHFRKEDILPSGRLATGSIPLPYTVLQPSTPSCTESNVIRDENITIGANVETCTLQTFPQPMSGFQPLSSPAVSTSSASFSVLQSPSIGHWIDHASPTRKEDRTRLTVKRSLFSSVPPKRTIENKLKQYRLKLSEKRTAICRLKKQIIKYRKKNQPMNRKLFKSKDAAVLCNMQLHKNRQSWTKDERKLSTVLYLKSPSTYKFLRERLVLPGKSTVHRWLSSKEVYRPGYKMSMINQIKLKASTMTEMERCVVLMFDEMSIKKCLEYSQKHDFIEGFRDTGHFGRGPGIAKQAAVFMVRGLYYHWKLPVAYFVTERGLTGEEMKALIVESVEKLGKADLKVKAVVCDQCSTNVSAYQKLNVTEDNPFFFNNSNDKIFALYDTPHLLKSLRNNIITHDFMLNGKRLSFSDIRELYRIETSSNTTRAAHQLSAAHIWPNSFQKLSVSLAAQIFSHTTSSALKTAHATGEIKSETVLNTANFISEINNLYDSMNSKKRKTPNPASCALSKTDSYVRTVLENGLKTFTGLRKLNATHPEPPCFRGFRLTISAILQLFQSQSSDYLLTSRLNQDPLENLFSSIRQRGGFNRNPTVRVFRGSIRVFALKQMMEPPKSTSYDPDLDDLLDIYASPTENVPIMKEGNTLVGDNLSIRGSYTTEESSSEGDREPEIDEGPVLLRNNTVTLEKCSQIYFAGYVAHSYYKKYKCNDCLKKMCDLESKLQSKKKLLLLNRAFSNVKVDPSSGLFSPSENLEHVVDVALRLFKNKFCKVGHKLHLVKRLVRLTKTMVSLDSLTCVNCDERSEFVVKFLFRVLIHKQCKWLSNEFKASALGKLKVLQHV